MLFSIIYNQLPTYRLYKTEYTELSVLLIGFKMYAV
jgi:hypothetical protein